MITALLVTTAVLAGSTLTTGPGPFVAISQGSIEGGLGGTPQAVVEFNDRIRTYMEIHRAVAQEAPPLRVTTVTGEHRPAIDALALGIRLRRIGANRETSSRLQSRP